MHEVDAHIVARLSYSIENTDNKQGVWQNSQSWLTLTPNRNGNKQKGEPGTTYKRLS
jgi:hypothetical protein